MTRFPLIGVAALALVTAGCSGDDSGPTPTGGSAPSTSVVITTTAAPTTAAPTTATSSTTVASTTVAPTTSIATSPVVWPASDVVFDEPLAAAADWVHRQFGIGPVLGEFMAGDSRSGEVELFAADENGQPISTARATVLVRQLGVSDGWFVIGVVSDGATIASPAAGASVPAAPLTVSGSARGFEATIVVSAQVGGDPTRELDRVVAMAGNLDQVAPYEVTLDLSGAAPGDTVVVMVRGGAGLETDPGDVTALAVTVS